MDANEKDSPNPPGPADKPKGPSVPQAVSTRPKAVQAPALTLPKGGGAVRGIGEKFSANPVTGGGSLRIPLPVSPGRGGFQPDLAIAYDSGAGNGPFGAGMHLSVPQISRKTDKGLPQYDDRHESDVFLLSEAEDLVPVLLSDGTPDAFPDDGEEVTIESQGGPGAVSIPGCLPDFGFRARQAFEWVASFWQSAAQESGKHGSHPLSNGRGAGICLIILFL